MAEFDITYRCNGNCLMCQRWQDPRRGEMTVAEYASIARELHSLGSHQISIAGGEPLMRTDAFDIVSTFAELGMSVNICTNGMLVDKYVDQICRSGATCVTVSVDGATAESHDSLRGTPGGYQTVEAGVHALVSLPKESRPIVRVRMTISNRNLPELRAFYHKWNGIADDVLIQPVHTCDDAFYTGLDPDACHLTPDILQQELKGTPLEKDPYMQRLYNSLRHEGRYPAHACYAGVLMARIDPWGNVYPCLEQHTRIGSVRENSFTTIWRSAAFEDERQRLRNGKSCRCWYNNTALIGHYGHLLSQTTISTAFDGALSLRPGPAKR